MPVHTDKSIFLPAAGYRGYGNLDSAGTDGYYWSRTLVSDYSHGADALYFDSGSVSAYYDYRRYYGLSVRPVRVQK